ncbi:hypothetical protein EYF80_022513 [Liparis tanakae]|uniref:Uncharacterized protein n=1 Tax=Liparis tanakae TaxID=230148 RepID=A0A4Z2HQK8_9TELE|nr:hypothetical protein EYF80_022513 [Liparis tanakae]
MAAGRPVFGLSILGYRRNMATGSMKRTRCACRYKQLILREHHQCLKYSFKELSEAVDSYAESQIHELLTLSRILEDRVFTLES